MLRAVASEVVSLDGRSEMHRLIVVCELPKIAPVKKKCNAIWAACAAPVTVTGRRAEGLGAIGRSEGIACWASVVVTR